MDPIRSKAAAKLACGLLILSSVALFPPRSLAADKPIKLGVTLPLTGADAEDAKLVEQGFMMAVSEANERHEIPGYRLDLRILNTATATAGQYDPAQAATDARMLIADPAVLANLGPYMSGEGKAIAPLFSAADLSTITPTSTNPDITDPKFASEFKPGGKTIYFRTCATDAFQGPLMANYMKEVLKVKSVFILDDSGAGGVGGADQFERRAKEIGLRVLGRDHLDPREADYTVVLTKIKGLRPDALYYAGVAGAGTKLIAQSYVILPNIIKAGVDGIYGADILKGAGFPAVQDWYITVPAPHIVDTEAGADWVKRFTARFGNQPSDYSALAYDAGLVAVDAVRQVVASGQPLDREHVEAAILATNIQSLQGNLAFNADGDVRDPIISIFRVEHDPAYPADDVTHQFKYIGVAPTE
jgi:branched-chain amino acid transport system substrate-binding protein